MQPTASFATRPNVAGYSVPLPATLPATLPAGLVEQILNRLGFNQTPEPTYNGLRRIYSAWCHRVPFDNVRKLIQVRGERVGPLPGSSAVDFFESWLRHGTGGTCWAGAGALQTLLSTLGFQANRGVATMLVAPDLPPNHGTVTVDIDASRFVVDSSILHGEPLALSKSEETWVNHPAWGVRCRRIDTRWQIDWRPLNRLDGFPCRLERFDTVEGEFPERYEQTRAWSPFNYEVTARINRGSSVVGLAFGHAVSISNEGRTRRDPISHEERQRRLIEEIGLSEEIVSQLPEDVPTPPPPGSQTALATDAPLR